MGEDAAGDGKGLGPRLDCAKAFFSFTRVTRGVGRADGEGEAFGETMTGDAAVLSCVKRFGDIPGTWPQPRAVSPQVNTTITPTRRDSIILASSFERPHPANAVLCRLSFDAVFLRFQGGEEKFKLRLIFLIIPFDGD